MQPDLALERIKSCGIIAVFRGDFPPEKALPICEVLVEAGITVLELTTNSPGWRGSVAALRDHFGDAVLVGMGTLLNAAHVKEALAAGAQFAVAPTLDAQAVAVAHAAGVLMAPGVATPSEAVQAVNLGAKLVKFFPAGPLGVDYFKAMRGPLNDIAFTCNGSITAQNGGDFLRAGAVALGVGGGALVGTGDLPLEQIRRNAQAMAEVVRAVRSA